jgi:hypothetical protein
MSVENVRRKVNEIALTEGRAALHAKNPNDFEYYALSFELVDSNFNSLKIFHFPVMPNAISISRPSPLNVKKTGHGYFTQYTDAFQAYTITLQGTFGRKFRLLIHKEETDKRLKDYDLNVKTGYGVTKVLEDMILQSQETVQQDVQTAGVENHKFLILYNLTFNQQFIVEVMNFQFTQSLENNTMWNYNLELKAMGDVRQLVGYDSNKSLKNLLTNAKLNKQANTVFDNLTAGGVFRTRAQLLNDNLLF